LEYIETEPAWLLDGAHNAHAFDALTATVRRELSHEDVVVLYGASDGHDYRQCLPKLSAAAAQIYLVDGFCRAVPTGELERLSRGQFLVAGTFPSPQTAVESLSQQRLPRGKTILVCGSLFLVGECRDCLRNRRLIRE
jgi:folylpolyglutamate synthase/dihydropteroate synthase